MLGRRIPALLIIVLLLLLLLRLTLIGRGANAFGDETRYWYSAQFLLALSKGDFHTAIEQFFYSNARPMLLVLYLPPVLIQSIVYKWIALDPRSPDSLLIPQCWFILCSVLQSAVFYALMRRWTGAPPRLAAGFTLCYGLLMPCNFYLRHLLPYDFLLLGWFVFFYYFQKIKSGFWIGFITACLLLSYPGWWILGLVVGFFILFLPGSFRMQRLLFVSVGGLVPVLFFEWLARCVGRSLLLEAMSAGTEYVQYLPAGKGSVRLLAVYLQELIGPLAFCLLLAWTGGLYRAFKPDGEHQALPLTIVAMSLGFVLQAGMGSLMDWQVFYGRLFYPFLPFAMLALGYCHRMLTGHGMGLRIGFIALICGLSMMKFAFYFPDFQKLAYPRDELYRYGFYNRPQGTDDYDIWSMTPPRDGLKRFDEYPDAEAYATIPPGHKEGLTPDSPDFTKGLWVNFSLPPRITDGYEYQPIAPADDPGWQTRKSHFFSCKAYWFEENYWGKAAFFKDQILHIGYFIQKGEAK
jgi:hypothetical protein